MKLKTYRNLWGMPGPRDAAAAAIEEAGYDGIESILFTPDQRTELGRILRRRRLLFKGGVWTRGAGPRAADHARAFERQLEGVLRIGASSVTAIGGYDGWDDDEAARYFEAVLRIGGACGVPVSHEIHRDSALYHPTPTRRILGLFPELRLTIDFSHWVVACERLIDDQLSLIRLCGRRALHLHVRVGTEEAPQVADPRAPEAQPYLAAFERWWDLVWDEQEAAGLAVTSLCPEFGPPPYQPTLPFTGLPLSDLAAVCDGQRERQVARFNARSAARRGRARTRR